MSDPEFARARRRAGGSTAMRASGLTVRRVIDLRLTASMICRRTGR